MPTLEFKGKLFVYLPHLSVPFSELVVDAKKILPVRSLVRAARDMLAVEDFRKPKSPAAPERTPEEFAEFRDQRARRIEGIAAARREQRQAEEGGAD